jgi:hypothetical protein
MYSRMPHLLAIAEMLANPPVEPLLGTLSTDKVQICPQNYGIFNEEMAAEVRKTLPHIEWRLHANVRVQREHRIVDMCDWPHERDYFADVARVSQALGAPAYSAHAGRRDRATVAQVLHNTREVEQLFGIPVAVEGHYPTRGNIWLFSTWQEYRVLLESGVHFVVDLSHLNIVAYRSGFVNWGLVWELLACERCIEVHVSDNDGSGDQHRLLEQEPWWFPLLAHVNAGATVFSEGRQQNTPLREQCGELPSPAKANVHIGPAP